MRRCCTRRCTRSASNRGRRSLRTSPSASSSRSATSRPGFAEADVVVEREFDTQPVHQGYIEPHACLASVSEDGQAELWCTTQGQFIVRSFCAKLLGMEQSKLRVTASEIGGGFGGKTVVYLEPLALALSRKAGQPVKMVMTRQEVFQATGPTSGAKMRVKIGATRGRPDRRGRGAAQVRGRRIPGLAGAARLHVRLRSVRPRERADRRLRRRREPAEGRRLPRAGRRRSRRSPSSPSSTRSRSGCGIDPIELRLKNAAKEGTKAAYGPKFGPIGLVQTLEAAREHPHYRAPLEGEPGPRRGVRVLVQHRRRNLRHAQPQRGRHRDAWSRARPTSAARAPRWR